MPYRKSNFLDTMLRIASFQRRRQAEAEQELSRFKKGAFIAAIMLVVVNVLLVLDVYLLPMKTRSDRIYEVVTWRSRNSESYHINTENGRRIFIENKGGIAPGNVLKFEESIIFSVPKYIQNVETHTEVKRAFKGYPIARVCALLFLVTGSVVLVFRRFLLRDNYLIFISLMVMAVAQAILLIM